MKAIKIFILLNHPNSEKITNDVKDCFLKLNNERPKIIDSQTYLWINRKYSDAKFHQIAKKTIFFGEDK